MHIKTVKMAQNDTKQGVKTAQIDTKTGKNGPNTHTKKQFKWPRLAQKWF